MQLSLFVSHKYFLKLRFTETTSLMLHDKVSNEEYWTLLNGNQKEFKYPKSLTPGHEYFVQIHVAEAQHEFHTRHKICHPVLSASFKAGNNAFI